MVNALLLPFLAIGIFQLLVFLLSSPRKAGPATEEEVIWRRRLRWAGVVTLLVGLLAAGLVYRRAARLPEPGETPAGYEVGSGYSYPIMPASTKRYNVQMEQIGGKGNVVAAEFRAWAASLWRGRRLAYTLAVISIGAGLACFFMARLMPG
jgi:hypothetical protein